MTANSRRNDEYCSAGPNLVAAVALPPPLHGQSLVNASVVELLARRKLSCRVIDISPRSRVRTLGYHLTRAGGVIRALYGLICTPRRRHVPLYTVLEAGAGIAYSMLLVGMARLLGHPIILHHHSSNHSIGRSRAFRLLTLIGGDMTHAVLSERMAEDLRFRYPDITRVIICPNAIHVNYTSSRVSSPRVPTKSLVVGLLSNLTREKGLDVAIDAVRLGRKKGLDVDLVLAGPVVGPAAALKIAEAERDLGKHLHLLGPLDGAEKSEFYENIDVFLFPTSYKYEAQPMVLLEAMSFAIPIIASDRGYIAELIGDCGVLLDSDATAEQALAALQILMANPTEIDRLRTAARERYLILRGLSLNGLEELVDTIRGA